MVMYRDFCMRKARSLKLTGTVKNEDDGSVTVVAEGERAALLQLTLLLKKGSALSSVESVDVKWESYIGEFSDFNILYK